jgi:hypothetical protein
LWKLPAAQRSQVLAKSFHVVDECARGLGGERAKGASTTAEDLTAAAAAAVEEQDGTLAASPPFIFALS